MSFGDSEPAPTYYFSGILFNPSFYTSSSSNYLTQTTAKKYFLTYPSAQGTETISNLISNAITYSSPASGSFFEVGVNQVSGGTIRVGPTGSSAGVSVHCGNIDFKNNTINNATAATTGSLSICDAQTQGVLNIATASRVKASGTSNGDINIGTGINSIASGTIPPQINIGNNPSALNATQILIGATNTTTTINGNLTANSGLTIGSGVGISLTSNSYNPSASQLGYVNTSTAGNFNISSVSSAGLLSTPSLAVGIYAITFTVPLTLWTVGAGQIITFTITTNANATANIPVYTVAGVSTTWQTGAVFSGYLQVSAASGSCSINAQITTGAGNVQSTAPKVCYIRIA